jgi:hypothetical protein
MEERESSRTCRTIQAIKPPKSFSLTIGKEMEKEKRRGALWILRIFDTNSSQCFQTGNHFHNF